jgi:hypothetical protein
MNDITLGINELSVKRERALSELKEYANFIDPFLEGKSGVKRNTQTSKHKRFHTTSTAYVFYYIQSIIDSSIGLDLPKALVDDLKKKMNDYGDELIKSFMSAKGPTAIGPIPNNYNTPMQIAGILSFIKGKADKKRNTALIRYIDKLIIGDDKSQWSIVPAIKNNNGYLSRISEEGGLIPSPYHTFWALEALQLFDKIASKDYTSEVQTIVSAWALDSLARSASLSSAGLSQSFDPIEVSYLLLILLSLSSSKSESLDEGGSFYKSKKLIDYCISVMFSKYFEKGCFTKSLPVFATSKNFSLTCPTVEPISILVIKHPEYFFDHIDSLASIVDWIRGNRVWSGDGSAWSWRSEWEHSSSPPTSFMSTSVFAFLVSYYKCLDDILSKAAFKALGVVPYSRDPFNDRIKYPGDLGYIVKNYVIGPIKDDNKNLAHYSIILFGPPGTSKTTISKKIAQDLEWPLLVINASIFLKSGLEKIDAEAERVFRLASYLKKVVVLFDEVEELVLRREPNENGVAADQKSRLLTTSMLPRINDLRSSSRIVFIFATNHVDQMDSAITRTGRFDCVHCVMPPNEKEREAIISGLISSYSIREIDLIKDMLLDPINLTRTSNFCYSDLRDLVKRIVVEVSEHSKNISPNSLRSKGRPRSVDIQDIRRIIDHEIEVGEDAAVDDTILKKFKELKDKRDRPRLKQPKQ